jgi:hypothetical protein
MSEISVLFQGMILWWTASNPAVVLVPDLTASQVPHTASISAQKSAFVGGVCPAGFETINNDSCFFPLDGAGNAGGVQIELLSNMPAPTALTSDSMCAMPPLQHTANDPFVLRRAYIPPSGTGNTAWMSVLGGTGAAVMSSSCENPPDCPRYMKWTVTAGPRSNVVLILKNLKASAPLLVQLSDDAELTIANAPVPAVLHGRREKRRAGSKVKEEPPLMKDSAEDWCSYFSMVALQSNPAQAAPCPGKPPIPACAAPLLTARWQPRGHGMGIQTIACSSSQYP